MSDDPHQTVTRVRDLQNQLRFLKREVKGILDTVQDIENEVDLVAGSVADLVAGSLVSCTEEDESCGAGNVDAALGIDGDESLPTGFVLGNEPRRCFKTPPPPPVLNWCEISRRWRNARTGQYAKPPPPTNPECPDVD